MIDEAKYLAEYPQHSLLIFYDSDPNVSGTEQFRLLDQTQLGTAYIDHACTALQYIELGTTISTEFGCSMFTDNIPPGTRLGGMWVKVYSCITFTEPIDLDEWNLLGTFMIDGNPRYKDVVSVTALDHYILLDGEINLTTFSQWMGSGKTASQYLAKICSDCAVTGAWTGIQNTSAFKVPEEQGMTYRQLLGWILGILGMIGYVTADGTLTCGYPQRNALTSAIAGQAVVGKAVVGASSDASQPIDITFTQSERFDSEYQDDVNITGIATVDADGVQTVIGQTGYVFDMSYNPLITYERMISIYGNTKGIKYNPMHMQTVPCPWIRPMDWVEYVTADGASKYGLVTNATHYINGHSFITCEGEL